jgi:hypothetical protein
MSQETGRRRVVIEGGEPDIDCGRFPVKRTVGETVTVEAELWGRWGESEPTEAPGPLVQRLSGKTCRPRAGSERGWPVCSAIPFVSGAAPLYTSQVPQADKLFVSGHPTVSHAR